MSKDNSHLLLLVEDGEYKAQGPLTIEDIDKSITTFKLEYKRRPYTIVLNMTDCFMLQQYFTEKREDDEVLYYKDIEVLYSDEINSGVIKIM